MTEEAMPASDADLDVPLEFFEVNKPISSEKQSMRHAIKENNGHELLIDLFAGGGGASTGIYLATGRHPDYAINHNHEALAMHLYNHPETITLPHDIWEVNPTELCRGRPVGLLWASPSCTHFSKAKGGKPLSKQLRSLAWVVVRWAKETKVRTIFVENVEEFQDWGALDENDRPCPKNKGKIFKSWVNALRKLGYAIEWKEIRACNHGAPTIRKRLFIIARNDGEPIVWPAHTHGDPKTELVRTGAITPWLTAADVIDWTIPCHSIFLTKEEGRAVGVKRPLVDATMERIAKGMKKYVFDAAAPFIVTCNHTDKTFRGQGINEPMKTITAARDAHGLISPIISYSQQGGANRPTSKPLHTITAFLAQHNSGVVGRAAEEPLSTVTLTGSHQAVVEAILETTIASGGIINMKGSDRRGRTIDAPTPTITARGEHVAEVRAFLTKYYGEGGQDQSITEPPHTVPTKARFGLVIVNDETWRVTDIGMRMLTPRELYTCQGFPSTYEIEKGICINTGEIIKFTKAAQIRMVGNSVSPPVARALVAANFKVRYFVSNPAANANNKRAPQLAAGE